MEQSYCNVGIVIATPDYADDYLLEKWINNSLDSIWSNLGKLRRRDRSSIDNLKRRVQW